MANSEREPRSELPPNFQTAGYAAIRQALITQHQTEERVLDDEWAASQLLNAWEEDIQTRQAAWEEAAAQEDRERAEAEAERLREEGEARKAEDKKKKARFPPIAPGSLPPKDSGSRPCDRAITKLKNREFMELWFFTFDGCRITTDATMHDEDNALSVIQEDGRIQLHRSSSTASYRHLVVPDELLTWKDILHGKTIFLEQIAKHKWPPEYLKMFTDFYCKLEIRSELRQTHGHGEKILIRYHARARREWFTTPFDISTINEEWMVEAHQEMWDSVLMQNIQKTEQKVK